MTKVMIDAEARRAIQEDLGDTLVVEAAAGTGKTTEMIARIVAVIRTGATTLDRLVAVTFTEKAAGEMKLRLRTELEKARVASDGDERARFERALSELEVARVGSIHQFCAEVLRERPVEAGVDPLFEVAAEDGSERVLTQAFDSWFQRALASPGEGVRRILRREHPADLLRRAAAALVERRDFTGAWARPGFGREAAIDHIVSELAALGGLASRADYPDDKLAQLFGMLDRFVAELGRRELVTGARDHDGLEAELHKVAKWWQWREAGRSKSYGQGLMRADLVVQRDAAKTDLDALLRAADADLAACLREELRPLVADYERLLARAGRVDFLDLLARTRDLLQRDHATRGELRERFTHFFVDEFQDTDPLQAEILLELCSDDRGRIVPGKLFVVGDPKQAIYRFRRADISFYEAVKERLVAAGAKLVNLTTSFRAVPDIQALVNAAFEPVMKGDGQASYVRLENWRASLENRPSVVALPVPKPYGRGQRITTYAIDESYPEAVAAFLDHAVRKSGWGIEARHVCLMFRRFQSFGHDLTMPYVRALEARGLAHVLVGGRSFHQREEIEAVRNALGAIEHPDDELLVYAALRGPLFALHDEDLVTFKHAHGRLQPLARLAPEGEVGAALALLGELHVKRNRRPIADTLSRLLAATRAHAGLACWPAGEQALANVLRVTDLARRFEADPHRTTSFRSFVDRLADDAEKSRQPDAPVVEDSTEGVRVMTVHAAKGLEFPVVILCDPCAPLESDRPSRHIDGDRWFEPLAGCVPAELREHAPEVTRRDREEVERLAYVACTRARDLLVVPVVGDEERETWLAALNPAVHPDPRRKRSPRDAAGCPAFGADSVLERPLRVQERMNDCVSPGLHAPRAGMHSVVWWDPWVLSLVPPSAGGLRQRQILQADASGETAVGSIRAHMEWKERRANSLASGARPSLRVSTVTAHAKIAYPTDFPVAVIESGADRHARPNGRRLGSLVHAMLQLVDVRAPDNLAEIARGQARVLAATDEEVAAALTAVRAALAHPLMQAAAAADVLRRETPVILQDGISTIEGIVDMAFLADGAWAIVDFKTDPVLAAETRATYEAQVRLYARAISDATGQPASAALFLV